MKHSFLILSVAFLFCGTGCGVRKFQKKEIFDQNTKNNSLITPSSASIARDSSCKNRKEEASFVTQVEQVNLSKKYSVKERIIEIEARLGDLPLPFMAKGISASDDGHGCYFIIAKTNLSVVDIIHFYNQEMQQLGWMKIAAFKYEELLFSFKKQKQSCIVSVRPGKQSWWSKKPTLLYVYLQA